MKNKMLTPMLSAAAILPFMCSNIYADSIGEVNTKQLNVRAGYSVEFKKLFTIDKGEKVEILDQNNGWFKIRTENNKSGWCNGKYITVLNSSKTISKITTTGLNVRKGASTSYSKIGYLPKGTKIDIYETKNGWSKIKYNGQDGWVSNNYITTDNTSYSLTSNSSKKGIIHTYDVNLRETESYSAKNLCVIKKNTTVEVLSSNSTWTKVRYNNQEGYVMTQYINIIASSDTTPSTPNTPSTPTLKGTVHTYDVNIRKTPSFSGEIAGVVKKNTTVDIFESKDAWYKVKVNGNEGWIPVTYVNVVSSNTPSTPNTSTDKVISSGVVYNTNSLNVRKGASTSYDKIGSLSKGTKVDIYETKNGWHRIKYNGQDGWVSATYINTSSVSNNNTSTDKVINSGVVYNTTSLNVRKGASTSYDKIGSLSKGTKVDIYESKNGWHRIKYNGQDGWVSASYINTSSVSEDFNGEYGYVATNLAPIRSSKSTNTFNNNVIFKLQKNEKVEILEQDSVWTTVRYEGKIGYMRKDHLDSNKKDALRKEVVSFAKEQLGKPYIYGNYGPDSFDCSGLVTYVFNEYLGFSLERTSNSQSKTSGELIDRNNLQEGDLVFFDPNKDGIVTHVGIYIGDGKMIHAPNSNDVVKIVSIESGYYYNAFHNARRVI